MSMKWNEKISREGKRQLSWKGGEDVAEEAGAEIGRKRWRDDSRIHCCH